MPSTERAAWAKVRAARPGFYMEKFIVIGIFVGLGALFRRLPVFPKQTAQVLNMFALYVALPAVILLKVPQIRMTFDMLAPVVVPYAMLLFSVLLVLLGSRFFRWSREATAVLLLVVPIGNTSFMGIPMVLAFFGEAGIPPLIVYDQLGTSLIFAVYGSVILALYAGAGKVSIPKVALRVVFFPPSLALIAGLLLRSWPYPAPVHDCLQALSGMLTPLVMTAIGFQLRVRLSPEILRPLGFGLALKLAVAPLAALLLCRAMGMNGLVANVAVFEAGMPPMVVAGALAMAAGLLPELAAAAVSLGMMLAFVSLPLLYWLL